MVDKPIFIPNGCLMYCNCKSEHACKDCKAKHSLDVFYAVASAYSNKALRELADKIDPNTGKVKMKAMF